MKDCLRQVSGGVLIDVHVVPNSSKESFSYDEHSKRLKVKIRSPPVEGKANKRLIEVFSSLFKGPRIVFGHNSRKKSVFIPEKTIEEVLKAFEGKERPE